VIILVLAGALISLLFFGSYSSRPASESGLTRLDNAIHATVKRICLSPGGIASIVVLSGLFYRFRTPPDRGTLEDGYELLDRALRLEKEGRIEDAIKAYEYIAVRYSATAAGQDAQKSIESLRALR
jgi:hypothetical protein